MNTNIWIEKKWCTWWLSWLALLCLVGNWNTYLDDSHWNLDELDVSGLVPLLNFWCLTFSTRKIIRWVTLPEINSKSTCQEATFKRKRESLPFAIYFPVRTMRYALEVGSAKWKTSTQLEIFQASGPLGVWTPDRSDPVMLGWKINPSKIL